jgi:hypothetical protein
MIEIRSVIVQIGVLLLALLRLLAEAARPGIDIPLHHEGSQVRVIGLHNLVDIPGVLVKPDKSTLRSVPVQNTQGMMGER